MNYIGDRGKAQPAGSRQGDKDQGGVAARAPQCGADHSRQRAKQRTGDFLQQVDLNVITVLACGDTALVGL